MASQMLRYLDLDIYIDMQMDSTKSKCSNLYVKGYLMYQVF